MTVYKGGCLCGAVRYECTEAPVNERICHCRLCQKAIGAAFNARLLFRIADLDIGGEVHWFASSEAIDRGSCPDCGTTLFSRRAANGVIGVTSGTLDDPSLFKPDMHFWVSSRQPWVTFDDGLPIYEESPPV
ncbi:MAG: aldehyde-activating protein [Rhizobiales bacterium]|nr:aldehyde-activating protein [Hyphomicrobiales bacterium]|tara:strand:- start:103 stop:498 length:396 start_codon:yes stop_codon:yes gene_type:complete